ncbi:hypothetical protein GPA19_11270 [Azoarcus indigens]|uniref:DUF4124 domain-containing protein n=1 Tax=Azoarcus indigens TaxID=29545 RepID=A0A4R6E119_9RHOO|nr:hypothetical protein [Azoarcus indigens]NMG65527.1 hypothetical protein [Azoarcus indigens]TDN51406.1 hypothetical protein C7389_107141 [Azoarcus indigens]
MKQNLLALALTLAIACGLGLYVWHDHKNVQATFTGQHPVPGPARPPGLNAGENGRPPPEPGPQLPRRHANGLYRCEQRGAVTYQGTPCPEDSTQAEVRNGSLSVAAKTAPVQPTSQPAPSGGERVGLIARAEEPWFGEANAPECYSLRRQIERIDAAARRYSTERLKEERRKAVRRKYDLGCSEFD